MPTLPGFTGTSSCFSLLSVLKTRSGMPSPFQGLDTARAQARDRAHARLPDQQGSAVEDGLQVALDVVLVDALRQRQLLDQDLHSVFHDLEHVEGLPLTGDVLVLDAHHFADALARVDGLVTDLESLHRDGLLTRSGIVSQGRT